MGFRSAGLLSEMRNRRLIWIGEVIWGKLLVRMGMVWRRPGLDLCAVVDGLDSHEWTGVGTIGMERTRRSFQERRFSWEVQGMC